MTDLERRFRSIDRLRAPDLKHDIRTREPRPPRREIPWARLGTAALALVIAAAGFAVAGRAFFGEEPGPASAPDTRIAFVVRENPAAIYTMNPDGTDVRKLVEGRDPAWSPDGMRLAFRRGRTAEPGGLTNRIYVADADGSNRRTIYEGDGSEPGGAGAPAWSPDGSQIAFAEVDGLRVMEADGSDVRLLVHNEEIHDCYATEPSWSPYGTRIAFAARCSGGDLGIFVVRPDGSDLRQLTGKAVEADGSGLSDNPPYLDSYPVWSPDGSRIAFVRRVDEPPLAPASVYVMEADGSDATKVSDAPHEGFYEFAPSWSPDSSTLAFTNAVEGRIYQINPDGTGLRPMTEPGLDACCPAWQPRSSIEASPSPSPSQTLGGAKGAELKVPVPEHPTGVTSLDGSMWVGIQGPDGYAVVRVDGETGEVQATIPVEHPVWHLAGGAGAIWTTGPGSQIQRIDPGLNRQSGTFKTGATYARSIAAGPEAVWVVTSRESDDEHTLVRLDPSSGQVVAETPLGIAGEGYIDEIALTEGSVWLMMHEALPGGVEGCGDVLRVDAQTNEVTARIPVNGLNMAVGAGEIWVSCRRGPDDFVVRRVDNETGEILDEDVTVPAGAWGPLAVGPDGVWLVGSDASDDRIVLLHLDASQEIDRRIPVGTFIYSGVTFDPELQTIWFAKVAPASLIRVDIS